MRAELNPYAPGAGLRRHQTSRSIVLHGLRGVGKTVLLNQFRAQADTAGWPDRVHGAADAGVRPAPG